MELKQQVEQYMDGIREIDQKAIEDATAYNASLLKIPMSLGRMEEIAIQLAGITGNIKNEMKKKCVIIMSADNGITERSFFRAQRSDGINDRMLYEICNGRWGIFQSITVGSFCL